MSTQQNSPQPNQGQKQAQKQAVQQVAGAFGFDIINWDSTEVDTLLQFINAIQGIARVMRFANQGLADKIINGLQTVEDWINEQRAGAGAALPGNQPQGNIQGQTQRSTQPPQRPKKNP